MINRRMLLIAGATSVGLAPICSKAKEGIIMGAIRWDGQYCDVYGEPCYEEEKALSKSRWRFRAPLHSNIDPENNVTFTPSQETFDAEIEAAANGGLAYWAYLAYGDPGATSINYNHSMMKGLTFHLQSQYIARIQFSLIVSTHHLGSIGHFEAAVKLIVDCCARDHYFKIFTKRPVIFLYYVDTDIPQLWGASLFNLKLAIDELRKQCNKALGSLPYIVVLSAPSAKAEEIRTGINADCISVYAVPVPEIIDIPFSEFRKTVKQYWTSEIEKSTGDVIPTVMVGWDARPRKETPPSWELHNADAHVLRRSVQAPTPAEFADECRDAVEFISSNSHRCPTKIGLIYAWNEDTEAGPLEPSLGDPSGSLLKALSKVIR